MTSVTPASASGAPEADRRDTRLRHVAQEFESLFLAQMLKTMRGRTGQQGMLAMTQAETLVRDLHDEELGRALARAGGIGLAEILVAAIKKAEHE